MNKYTKNMLWFNIEKIIFYSVIIAWSILIITCATSCSTSNELAKHSKEYPCVFTN